MARPEREKTPRLVPLASVCIAIAALYFAQRFLIPLALSVLLSFLLAPLVRRLERLRIPRAVAVVIVVTLIFSLVAVLAWVVSVQVHDLATQLPSYKDNIVHKVQSIRQRGTGTIGKASKAIKDVQDAFAATTQPTVKPAVNPATPTTPKPVLIDYITGALGEWFSTVPAMIAATGFGILGTGVVVIVFVVFMLLQREDLRDRLLRLAGEGQLHLATQAIDDAAGRISRYLTAQAVVNTTYGLSISLGLCVIGWTMGGGWFPSFVLWGLLCGVMRFIPYVGPVIASIFPILISLAVYDGYHVFLAVGIMFIAIEAVGNNVLEPWIYGSSTGMSTIAIIVAAAFWTWLWGPVGLLLATPLTVCIVVIGKYVPQFQFLDIILGDQPVLAPHERVYQRMLAMDAEEATEVAEAFRAEHSLEETYDTILLPALALAEHDRHANAVDEERTEFIRRALRELVDELGENEKVRASVQTAEETKLAAHELAAHTQPTIRASLPTGCVINVLCLPAHDYADEIAAAALSQLLTLRGYCATALSENALASEMIVQVEKSAANIVCISSLPPAAVTHARYLCKRLHAKFPDMKHVIGVWTVKSDLKRAKERMSCAGDATLVTNFQQALEQIHEISQPMIGKVQSDE